MIYLRPVALAVMHLPWSLRLVTDGAPDTASPRGLGHSQGSAAMNNTLNEQVPSADEEFLDSASPDTSSEVSQYHDAQSEGMSRHITLVKRYGQLIH